MKNNVVWFEFPIRSKKSYYRRRKGSGLFIPDDMQAELDAIAKHLRKLRAIHKDYGIMLEVLVDTKRKKVRVGIYELTKYTLKRHSDLDGIITTICDLLQKEKRIFNDNRIVKIFSAII